MDSRAKANAAHQEPRDYIFDAALQGTQMQIGDSEVRPRRQSARDEHDDVYYAAFFKANRAVVERRPNESIAASAAMDGRAWEAAGKPSVPVSRPATATAPASRIVGRKHDGEYEWERAIGISDASVRLHPDRGVESPDLVTVRATASAFSFTLCSHRRAHANSSPEDRETGWDDDERRSRQRDHCDTDRQHGEADNRDDDAFSQSERDVGHD